MPPGYGTPYGAPPASASNQLSLISMILGIVSIVATPCCSFVALPLGVGAVATGIIALSQLKSNPRQQGKGQAVAGVACGAAALVLFVGLIILQVSIFTFTGYE